MSDAKQDARTRMGSALHSLSPREGGGRASTGFGALARRPEESPSPQGPSDVVTPVAVLPSSEPTSHRIEGEPVNRDDASSQQVPSRTLPVEIRRPAEKVGSVVHLLSGGTSVIEGGSMVRKSITLDNQVAAYIQDRFLSATRTRAEAINADPESDQSRVTMSGLLRIAIEFPLDLETGRDGKKILASRHRQFGSWRTTIEIREQVMGAIRVEMSRYSSRRNLLTESAVIELRIASWAVTQNDWPHR